MRILYFTYIINGIGGYSRIVIDKMNYLAEHGYEVYMCNTDAPEIAPVYPLSDKVHRITAQLDTRPGNLFVRAKEILASIKKIKSVIEEVCPDVIVNAHVPLVSWFLPYICRSVPKVVEIHLSRQGIDIFESRFMPKWSRGIHRMSTRFIYGQYDKFICLTDADREEWHLKNCMTIHNFTAQEKEAFEDNDMSAKQIILMGRLSAQKRFDLMIGIWAKVHRNFPDWKVVILGEGEDRKDLESLIEENDLQDSFILRGNVLDVESEMRQSSVMCQTSEYEGFSVVLAEGLQKGMPLVAFDYSGVRDAIEDGYNGYVLPFGDIDAFAESLMKVMTSVELRKQLRTAALNKANEFSRETIMNRWMSLFDDLSNH